MLACQMKRCTFACLLHEPVHTRKLLQVKPSGYMVLKPPKASHHLTGTALSSCKLLRVPCPAALSAAGLALLAVPIYLERILCPRLTHTHAHTHARTHTMIHTHTEPCATHLVHLLPAAHAILHESAAQGVPLPAQPRSQPPAACLSHTAPSGPPPCSATACWPSALPRPWPGLRLCALGGELLGE